MVCKQCSTRLASGDTTCPNCGRSSGDTMSGVTASKKKSSRSAGKAKGKAKAKGKGNMDADELELEELVDLDGSDELDLEDPADADMEDVDVDVEADEEAPGPGFALDAAGLRDMLALRPEILEPGLRVVKDTKGNPAGAGYATDVGEIDLLAQDKSKDFVVLMVAEPGQAEAILGEVLQRVGWVRKHLAKDKRRVRGIVLVDEDSADLSYSAAAVAGTIEFKTYRVGVTFRDLKF